MERMAEMVQNLVKMASREKMAGMANVVVTAATAAMGTTVDPVVTVAMAATEELAVMAAASITTTGGMTTMTTKRNHICKVEKSTLGFPFDTVTFATDRLK